MKFKKEKSFSNYCMDMINEEYMDSCYQNSIQNDSKIFFKLILMIEVGQ